MVSLNELVKNCFFARSSRIDEKETEIELILDPSMPKIYEKEEYQTRTTNMLFELIGEHEDLLYEFEDNKKFTKLRIETLFDAETQTQMLSISHNGKPIPKETIDLLNKKLTRVAVEGLNPGSRGGATRATAQISEYGGQISIHNLIDGEYNVDTIATLPLQNSY